MGSSGHTNQRGWHRAAYLVQWRELAQAVLTQVVQAQAVQAQAVWAQAVWAQDVWVRAQRGGLRSF